MNKTKHVVNVFVSHCDSITNGVLSTSSITYAILTFLDPCTDIVKELSTVSLPQSTNPYVLVVDHGIQNGFGAFRFEAYTVNEAGHIVEPSPHGYYSIDDEWKQQADAILFSQLSDMPKEDIIKTLLIQKGHLL